MSDQPLVRIQKAIRQLCRPGPNGHWIHRTPHTCPAQVRSQMPPRKRRKR